jgi:hypothetical protein
MLTTLLLLTTVLSTPTERLLDARARAYAANFRNHTAALRKAVVDFRELTADPTVGPMALYYASWTEWMVAASELEAKRQPEAIQAAGRAVDYARRALERRADDVEVITMLTNALVALAVLDRAQFAKLVDEIRTLRARAIALGPSNPRVVLMDAGMIFNNPPERGGGQEKGTVRWLEAMDLFEREAKTSVEDPLRPRWGRDLAYGWLAQLYLSTKPPQLDKAREAANTALRLQPDFWYVKERVLPRLK